MRFLLRSGLVLGLGFMIGACGEDSPAPTDFEDPAAITANLASLDSAFDSDVFRSFDAATFYLDVAAPQPAALTAAVREELRTQLARAGAQMVVPTLERSQRLQALLPQFSAASAQGLVIPDSLYERVYEWDEAADDYVWNGATAEGLNGIRFELYALDLSGAVVEPVTQIGTLDIIDQSVGNTAELHILVRDLSGTTFVDYTATVSAGTNSAAISVAGELSNGLADPDNKTLSFNQTLTVNETGVRINATFTLNNPVLSITLIESLTFDEPNLVITVDFRIVQAGETIRLAGRIVIDPEAELATANITVYRNGGPVASISGDLSDPATQWVDRGGEPLTPADLAALDGLFDAMEAFEFAIGSLFAPMGIFAGNI